MSIREFVDVAALACSQGQILCLFHPFLLSLLAVGPGAPATEELLDTSPPLLFKYSISYDL